MQKDRFLGYSSTITNIIYLNKDTKQIKTTNDYDFNELFIDLNNPSPNAKILRAHFFRYESPTIEKLSSTPEIMALDHLFLSLKLYVIAWTYNHLTFGLYFLENNLNHRACINEIFHNTSASSLKFQQCNIIGTYIIDINGQLVYTLPKVNNAISKAYISNAL